MITFSIQESPGKHGPKYRVEASDGSDAEATRIIDDPRYWRRGTPMRAATVAVTHKCKPYGVDAVGYYWLEKDAALNAANVARKAAT